MDLHLVKPVATDTLKSLLSRLHTFLEGIEGFDPAI